MLHLLHLFAVETTTDIYESDRGYLREIPMNVESNYSRCAISRREVATCERLQLEGRQRHEDVECLKG